MLVFNRRTCQTWAKGLKEREREDVQSMSENLKKNSKDYSRNSVPIRNIIIARTYLIYIVKEDQVKKKKELKRKSSWKREKKYIKQKFELQILILSRKSLEFLSIGQLTTHPYLRKTKFGWIVWKVEVLSNSQIWLYWIWSVIFFSWWTWWWWW